MTVSERVTTCAVQSKMVWVYLQHVVYDVQFDDRLSPDQVVHHGVIHVAHHEVTQHHDEPLQHITHLCWLEQTGATNTNTNIYLNVSE